MAQEDGAGIGVDREKGRSTRVGCYPRPFVGWHAGTFRSLCSRGVLIVASPALRDNPLRSSRVAFCSCFVWWFCNYVCDRDWPVTFNVGISHGGVLAV